MRVAHFTHSIRVQLTLAATLVVAVIVGGFALGSYAWFRAQLEQELQSFALHEAQEVASVVAGARTPAELASLHGELGRLLPEEGVLSVEIWGLDGSLLYHRADGEPGLPVEWSDGLAAARQQRAIYRTVGGPTGPIGLRTAVLVHYGREPRWVVTATVSRDRADASLANLRTGTWLGVAATTLLTLIVAGTIVTRALRPVQQLVGDAEKIKREGPGRRLAPPPAGSELAELAALLNEMLEQTEVSLDRLRRFTAHAGHELRTPLTRIRGEVESALAPGHEKQMREALEGVLEDVEALRAIIDALLELARGDEPLLRDAASVDLTEVLEELAEQARVVGDDRRIQVELDVPEAAVVVHGSRALLARAIWNLLDNALRFSPPGGRVRARIEPLGKDRVSLEVEDEGPGLGESPERLFEPFVRGERQPAHQRTGLGLGLALSRAIARRHGGDITAVDGEGAGARLRLSLPGHPVGAGDPMADRPIPVAPASGRWAGTCG